MSILQRLCPWSQSVYFCVRHKLCSAFSLNHCNRYCNPSLLCFLTQSSSWMTKGDGCYLKEGRTTGYGLYIHNQNPSQAHLCAKGDRETSRLNLKTMSSGSSSCIYLFKHLSPPAKEAQSAVHMENQTLYSTKA